MKTVEVHCNYSRPFTIEYTVSHKEATIYKNKYEGETLVRDRKVIAIDYKKIYLGDDPHHFSPVWEDQMLGNSVLFHLDSGEYIYVGRNVMRFNLLEGDKFVEYNSPVGNNDVPYPYIVGKTHVYFLIEDTVVSVDDIDLKRDPYGQLYGHTKAKHDGGFIQKKFKSKILVPSRP